MKLVQYSDQKHVTLSPSTFKDGLDIKVEDKVILSIIPEGYENTAQRMRSKLQDNLFAEK